MFIIVMIICLVGFLIAAIYLASRIFDWIRAIWPGANGIIYAILFAAFPFCLVLGQALPPCLASKVMKIIGTYWLGVVLYALLYVAALDLIRLITRALKIRDKKWWHERKQRIISGAVAAALAIGTLTYGFVHFLNVEVREYEVNIDVPCKNEELSVAFVSDIHLGSTMSTDKAEDMVEKINAMKPDIVCVPGDIFDITVYSVENRDAFAEIFAGIESKYGVYACLGNHDISAYAGGPENEEFYRFFEKAGWKMLDDESLLIDNSFYITGRMDESPISAKEPIDRASIRKLTQNLDKEKPVIMLDHQPDQLKQAAASGVDLLLCGHTHNGQTFPGNILINFISENGYGYKQIGGLHAITTSGVGIWGPPVRVGTDSEVVHINVHFAGQSS